MVKPKENPSEQEEKNEIWSDPRFSHLVSDPRFKNLPKSERKVKIDKRFESMFNDKKFKVKYTVDKYGRKINKTSSEDLKKYYDIGSSDDGEEEAKEKQKEEKQIVKDDDEPEVDENDVLQSDGEEVPATLKERLLDPSVDYARGEGRLISDSSSDDESSEDDDEELFIEHVWGELDRDAETTEESSKRLAVCNMDWDRIRASDIMVVCSSFLPPGGSILSVSIYPSEFGKQRMAEEEKYGPPELVKKNNEEENSDSDEELVKEQDSDAEEGDDYHMEKLRQYQLNRLKYYYAVIVCDSVETADKIYQECDGIEYESSATKIDLRFIPDDTSFDDDEPRDVCTTLPEVGQYKPRNFTTTALQQATVDLTWDETSLERREVGDKLLSGKMNEVSDADLRKFVAYSSEEEDEGEDDEEKEDNNARDKNEKKTKEQADEVEEKSSNETKPPPAEGKKKKKEDPISKYKALLQEITEKEEKAKKNKFEMEYSWDVAAEEKSTEKPEEKAKPALTPIEKVLQKRSEKNKRRKEERKKKKKQANGSDDDDGAIDSDQSDDYPDGIDMNDPYFAEEFANGDFEAPKSKKKDKNKKKTKKTESDNEEEEQKAKELQLLMDDDEEDDKQHFSLEKIIKTENETKSKKKRKKQLKKSKGEINSAKKEVDDNFEVNVEDDRFKAIFSSHHFNIDPTDSHFKKTKGMEQIIHEKLKRRHGHGDNKKNPVVEDETESKRPKKLIENSMLVKSLKRKLQQQSNGRK
ncbi:ESF1 homolog [Episyrphus balteatus]|uniref:ESF1 homolog n=1 Tax=Episyrphus balteatus TaxID=286459 RepID=UPI0024854903|nr:ESF1 homolog [Episyrphus balteatus]